MSWPCHFSIIRAFVEFARDSTLYAFLSLPMRLAILQNTTHARALSLVLHWCTRARLILLQVSLVSSSLTSARSACRVSQPPPDFGAHASQSDCCLDRDASLSLSYFLVPAQTLLMTRIMSSTSKLVIAAKAPVINYVCTS